MDYFNIKDPIPITFTNDKKLNHFTYDGCSYYFTIDSDKLIMKTSPEFCLEKEFETCRKYDCICYDFVSHCFWASAKNCNKQIYQLDCYMNEIDCISTCSCLDIAGEITGISYDCNKDSIVVSFPHCVVEMKKDSYSLEKIYTCSDGNIASVLSLHPGLIILILKNNKPYLNIVTHSTPVEKTIEIDCDYTVKDMVFNPCFNKKHTEFIEYLVLKKYCYPYVYRQSVSCNTLGYQPCRCNYQICKECCCENHEIPCKNPCSDIVESIALVETALSHILNAEGEKLQKVLATTDDIEKILCINKGISKTIVDITHLEQVLYDKLEIILDKWDCGSSCNNHCYHCNKKNTDKCR